MTRSIHNLRDALNSSVESVVNSPRQFGDHKSISIALSKIKKRVDASSTKAVTKDRMRDALHCINSSGVEFAMNGYARFIVRALSTDIDGRLLIKEPDIFNQIMSELNTLVSTNKLRASVLKGLIDSYFLVDIINCNLIDDDVDSKLISNNWGILRQFLNTNICQIMQAARYRPKWMDVIDENRQLFDIKPCETYASEVLAGNTSIVDELKTGLSIPDVSWFWFHLVQEQIDKIASKKDGEYMSHLNIALELISKMPVLINESLPILLDRYSIIQKREPHEELKIFSTKHWGNPGLEREAKWGLVSDEARQMVREWLVLEDLSDFFEVLQDDGGADQRRFKYWLRFLKQIDYAKIALGDTAMYSNKPDLVELRKRKIKRISSLTGASSVNSFILKIDNHIIVEFSMTGNATYGYYKASLPFSLEQRSFSIHHLKNKPESCLWGSHSDGRQSWEEKFDYSLAQLGIYPDKETVNYKAIKRTENIKYKDHSSNDRNNITKNNNTSKIKTLIKKVKNKKLTEFEPEQIIEFLRFNGLPYIDHRKDGVGQIFVKHKLEKGMTSDKLKLMGFSFRPNMGFVKII